MTVWRKLRQFHERYAQRRLVTPGGRRQAGIYDEAQQLQQ